MGSITLSWFFMVINVNMKINREVEAEREREGRKRFDLKEFY